MKKLTFLLLLISMVMIQSCSPMALESAGEIRVVDALDREIIFDQPPSRIVISGRQTPMLTHFFYLFDSADEKILAIENRSQSTEEFISLIDDQIGDKYLIERGASAEQITPLNPDAVVMKTGMRESVGLLLEELGTPVIYVDFESIDDTYRDLGVIASLLDEEGRGVEIINQYRNMKSKIDNRIDTETDQVQASILMLQSVKDDQVITFSVPSKDWLQTAMVTELGGNPVWAGSVSGGGWAEVNLEQIAAWDADIIFLVNYQGNAPEILDEIYKNEIWQQLKAVRNGNIYPFIFDFLSWDQPDPRFILAYAWMANRIYPEMVDSELVYQQINQFFADFFNIEDNQFYIGMQERIEVYFK
jgi:iron complex transport system substrate-binding protein